MDGEDVPEDFLRSEVLPADDLVDAQRALDTAPVLVRKARIRLHLFDEPMSKAAVAVKRSRFEVRRAIVAQAARFAA